MRAMAVAARTGVDQPAAPLEVVAAKATRRLRIAHVITGLQLGGGGQVVLTLARGIDRDRFEMDVYCVHEGGDIEAPLRQLGSSVFLLPGAWDYRRRLLRYSPRQTMELASLLRRGRYDILHTHLFQADAIGRVAGRLAGIPVMVKSLHNMGRWKNRSQVLVDRVLARWTDRVICCSDYQREVARAQEHFRPNMAVTIAHGVDITLFPARVDRAAARVAIGLHPQRPTIGTVGRTIREKGHAHLLDAIPAILQQHQAAQFVIVGDGALRTELEARVARTPYRERVCFAGARPDVPEMLALMDVFVFPSLSEGFGIAVVEAMAASLPVVTSNIRPLSEIVVQGKTGFLVDPADSPALAAALNRLLADPLLRESQGREGRRLVEARYTQAAMARAHERLYLELYHAAINRDRSRA